MITKLRLILVASAYPTATLAQPALLPVSIEWSVKDRFRLFDQVTSEKERRRIEQALTSTDALLAAGRPLSEAHDLLRDTLALEAASTLRASNFKPHAHGAAQRSGRYSRDYLYPVGYTIRVRAKHVPASASCHWRVGNESRTRNCGADAEILIPATASGNGGEADLFLAVNGGAETLAERIKLTDLLVVAMGDSYISGEGNPDVPARYHVKVDTRFQSTHWPAHLKVGANGDVTAAQWWDQPCHRSLLSWPVLASFAHAARNPRQAVTLVHLGCSGDEVTDGLLEARQELPGGGSEYQSQIEMLEVLRARPGRVRPVDKLLLAIGGNDIGFAPVVAAVLLPPNGWRAGNFLGSIAGDKGGAACPYRKENEARPLSRFCGKLKVDKNGIVRDRRSAQERLEELDDRLAKLDAAVEKAKVDDKNVFQITYPNALLDDQLQPCRTGLTGDDIRRIERRIDWSWLLGGREKWEERLAIETSYARQYPERIDAGFEGLIAQVESSVRGRRPWRFQIQYYPEAASEPRLDPAGAPEARCDWNVEADDSEFCQAYWVWASLNRTIRDEARNRTGWTIVEGYQDAIKPHGWCNATAKFQLRLPLRENGAWRGDWAPESFEAYDKNLPRWFRTSNDSILTQYESAEHHHKGTMHPNFRAHLEIADAILAAAFAGAVRSRP